MDRATHCPNCFQEPAPTLRCSHCGFDAASYLKTNEILPLFTPLAGGKYLVGRMLGQGGFGVVYAGFFAKRLNRKVAVKEFFPKLPPVLEALRQGIMVIVRDKQKAEFEVQKQRFLLEAEILAQFRHPRLVQIDDCIEENNTIYLIMERLTGHTLTEHLGGLWDAQDGLLKTARALPPENVSRLLYAALEGLEVLHGHARPVIHRDLTPNNLFLEGEQVERLKVLDFGLARFGIAKGSTLGGTLAFAAPEQLGYYGRHITPATDFYTLGASLYTALTGISPPGAIQRHAEQLPKPLLLPPSVDPTLAQVIRACLEMDPERRPKSVAEIHKQLAAGTVLFPDPEPLLPSPLEPKPKPEFEPKPAPKPELPKPASQSEPKPAPKRALKSELKSQSIPKPQSELKFLLGVSGFIIFLFISVFLYISLPKNLPTFRFELNDPMTWNLFAAALSMITIVFFFAYSNKSKPNLQPIPEPVLEPTPLLIPKSALEPAPFQVFRDRLRDGTEGPAMIVIPAGSVLIEFQGRDPEQEEFKVGSFAIGQYTVTFAEYDRFCDATGREKPDDAGWGREMRPTININLDDVDAYIDWLSQETGQRYRLPDDIEWEYAARAGTTTAFWWGDQIASDQANFHNNYGKTVPVNNFKPNPWGLYQVHGNIWEITIQMVLGYVGSMPRCWSTFITGSNSNHAVVQGGSWDNDFVSSSSIRFFGHNSNSSSTIGFRLARSLLKKSAGENITPNYELYRRKKHDSRDS